MPATRPSAGRARDAAPRSAAGARCAAMTQRAVLDEACRRRTRSATFSRAVRWPCAGAWRPPRAAASSSPSACRASTAPRSASSAARRVVAARRRRRAPRRPRGGAIDATACPSARARRPRPPRASPAVRLGDDLVLHLHRLDHDHRRARRYASTDGGDQDDGARHGGDQLSHAARAYPLGRGDWPGGVVLLLTHAVSREHTPHHGHLRTPSAAGTQSFDRLAAHIMPV